MRSKEYLQSDSNWEQQKTVADFIMPKTKALNPQRCHLGGLIFSLVFGLGLAKLTSSAMANQSR
jgi:hypothetical protein